jgi:Domain of unknown function (DUF6647)
MDTILDGFAFALLAVARVLAAIAAREWTLDVTIRAPGKELTNSGRSTRTALLGGVLLLSASASGAVAADQIDQQKVKIPGTDYEISLGILEGKPESLLTPSLLTAVETWLATQFNLPSIDIHPHVKFVPSERIASLRYRSLLSNAASERADQVKSIVRDTVAIYVDSERTIYLSDGWADGEIPYLSVLVHEMVHHMQNLAGLKYACSQEREKLAYMAQERWLGLFGHSLEQDFALDAFSLFPRTRCLF